MHRCDTGDMWNPDVYLAFADQRGRPFFDLLSRVGAEKPRRVVDLGCGPGNLTVSLPQRWPDAVVEAWDSSPEMVQAAPRAWRRRGGRRRADLDAEAGHRRGGEQRNAALGARTRRAAGPMGRSAARRVVDRDAGAGQFRRAVASGGADRGAPGAVRKPAARYAVSRRQGGGLGRRVREQAHRRRLHGRRVGDHLYPRADR